MTLPVHKSGAQIINCWNSIGVWGKERPRCPLLEQVIHCHNCEKFTAAGRTALERPMPPDYAQEWARLLAQAKAQEAQQTVSVVVFRIGGEWFSLGLRYVERIERDRVIHSLPHQNSSTVKGVVNIAGEIKLCFSLGALLGLDQPALADAASRTAVARGLLVLKKDKKSYVFPVSEVREMQRLDLSEIKAVPATVSLEAASYLVGTFQYGNARAGHLDVDILTAGLDRSIR